MYTWRVHIKKPYMTDSFNIVADNIVDATSNACTYLTISYENSLEWEIISINKN